MAAEKPLFSPATLNWCNRLIATAIMEDREGLLRQFLEFTLVGFVIGTIMAVGYTVVWENIPVAIGLGAIPLIVGIALGIVNRAK